MVITNLTFGGAQRVFEDHRRLLSQTCDVTEAVFNLADGHAFPGSAPVVDLGVGGGGSVFAKMINFAKRVRRLREVKRRLEPAVCISHLEGADYVNVLSRHREKIVLCVHGSKLHDRNIRGVFGLARRRILIPLLYNRADGIVTVSGEIGIELQALGVRPSLIRPIHNFFDPAAIREQASMALTEAEQEIFSGPPVLVTSGRLTLQKNQAALIALFAELLHRRKARLLLLGDGELRLKLIEQARSLGLRVFDAADGKSLGVEYDVYFLGFQDNPFRLQRHGQAFVLTSGWEGFPMVIGEAMACGLPIVSADCPTGPREFLAPDTIGHAGCPLSGAECGDFGLLMPIPKVHVSATIAVWVEGLDRLLADEDRRKRMIAQSLARAEDFTRETIGNQWLALVDELITPDPTASA